MLLRRCCTRTAPLISDKLVGFNRQARRVKGHRPAGPSSRVSPRQSCARLNAPPAEPEPPLPAFIFTTTSPGFPRASVNVGAFPSGSAARYPFSSSRRQALCGAIVGERSSGTCFSSRCQRPHADPSSSRDARHPLPGPRRHPHGHRAASACCRATSHRRGRAETVPARCARDNAPAPPRRRAHSVFISGSFSSPPTEKSRALAFCIQHGEPEMVSAG
jgi:hypothetical protein